MSLLKTDFTEGFLLRAFCAIHVSNPTPIESPFVNANGYYTHFQDVSIQSRWEEWQVCSRSMLVLLDDTLKSYEAIATR